MISPAEISRKLLHLFNLIIPIAYVFIVPDRNQMTVIMVIVAFLFVSIDLARMHFDFIKKMFGKLFHSMMREHEISGRFTGATWVAIIAVPVIYIFPKEIAVLSLVYMSVGDTAAAIVGLSIGKTKIGNKSLEGAIACLTVCIATALLINIVPVAVAITGAVMATVFELLPIDIDDNILVPIGAGTTMYIVSYFII